GPALHRVAFQRCQAAPRSCSFEVLFCGIAVAIRLRAPGLFFEGFEIVVIDLADDINKHSAFAIRFMECDGRCHGLSRQITWLNSTVFRGAKSQRKIVVEFLPLDSWTAR